MTGHRFSFTPIRDRCGGTTADTANRLNLTGATVIKHTNRGVTPPVADLFAQQLGCHPSELWDDWWTHEDTTPATTPTVIDPPTPVQFTLWASCQRCGNPLNLVAEGTPQDAGRRLTILVTCTQGHRSTLTATLDAA